eukprot:15349497-Ditylum_brightwellii.AAC.1
MQRACQPDVLKPHQNGEGDKKIGYPECLCIPVSMQDVTNIKCPSDACLQEHLKNITTQLAWHRFLPNAIPDIKNKDTMQPSRPVTSMGHTHQGLLMHVCGETKHKRLQGTHRLSNIPVHGTSGGKEMGLTLLCSAVPGGNANPGNNRTNHQHLGAGNARTAHPTAPPTAPAV